MNSPDSRQCQNCGTLLQGKFCHHCGQEQLSDSRFFGAVMLDLLGTFFSYDSKANRTLKPLLTKPGFLSNEYIDGRRARYISPFRLYLFTSVVCFLLLSLQGNIFSLQPEGDISNQPTSTIEAEPTFQEIFEQANSDSVSNSETGEHSFSIDLPKGYKGLEQFLQRKAKRLGDLTGSQLMKLVFDTLPPMMLVLLPFLALLMKGLYIGSKRYYVEHFVVVLHSQSFLFLLIIVVQLLGLVFDWLPAQVSWIGTLITVSLAIWAFTYIPLMLRRVYKQSRFVTILKYCLLLLIYVLLTILLFLLSLAWNIFSL